MFRAFKRKQWLGTAPNLLGGALRVYGIDTTIEMPDEFDPAIEFLSQLNASAQVAGPYTLTTPSFDTVRPRTFTHENITWPSLPTAPVRAVLYVRWTGSASTSDLVHLQNVVATIPSASQVLRVRAVGIVKD